MEEVVLDDLNPHLKKQIGKAVQAVEKGNSGFAIPVYMELLKRYPGCVEVRRLLRKAQVATAPGEEKRADNLPLKLIYGVVRKAGLKQRVSQNPVHALEQVEKMLEKDPGNRACHEILGAASEKLELWNTAVFAYETIRNLDPECLPNLKKLVRAYLRAGNPEKAICLVESILKSNPEDTEAQELAKRASVAHSMRPENWSEDGGYSTRTRDEEAIHVGEAERETLWSKSALNRRINRFKAEIDREPEQVHHYRDLADLYKRTGNPEAALHWIEKARKMQMGMRDEALEHLEFELRISILEAALESMEENKGEINSSEQERRDAARSALVQCRLDYARSLVKRYPQEAEYRYELGSLLLDRGELDSAITELQEARDHPKARLRALHLLGRAYMRKGFHDLGVEHLQAAKSNSSSMDAAFKKEILYELALCHEIMGNREEAFAEFKRLYSVDNNYRDVPDRLKRYYSL